MAKTPTKCNARRSRSQSASNLQNTSLSASGDATENARELGGSTATGTVAVFAVAASPAGTEGASTEGGQIPEIVYVPSVAAVTADNESLPTHDKALVPSVAVTGAQPSILAVSDVNSLRGPLGGGNGDQDVSYARTRPGTATADADISITPAQEVQIEGFSAAIAAFRAQQSRESA
ncbi:hypothetical protein OBBRIDRAFT_837639 [Obba rivulosa]|uniref:Uncharacterized protein n=1 Tax=Obba rivulosa TaxID=1052685 RepID=A0A8E2AM89_9APHY|nr:hypothetical protein OBBRIDRAFT_837639 [Obba rivulosa]